jgi:hypothetical protein
VATEPGICSNATDPKFVESINNLRAHTNECARVVWNLPGRMIVEGKECTCGLSNTLLALGIEDTDT